jgi:hypothetical protein
MRETSISLRGVPSGIAGSNSTRPVKPTAWATEAGEFADRELFAGADVDVAGLRVAVEEHEAGLGEVVGMQEFAERRARAPSFKVASPRSFASCILRIIAGSTCEFSSEKLSPVP